MKNEHFEWDDDKAEANLAKHGISFLAATEVFNDCYAVDFMDGREDYGEDRSIMIGFSENRLLAVLYTLRGQRYRIISARRPDAPEIREYHDQERTH